MSDEITFNISIPADIDGYVLLQCEHCGAYFRCTANDLEDESILNIYCPNCSLISDNYLTEDVIKLAMAKVVNYANDLLFDAFKDLERHNRNNNAITFKAGKKPKHKDETPIYSTIDSLEEKYYPCCKRSVKINPLLKMTASHCAFCGGIHFADE